MEAIFVLLALAVVAFGISIVVAKKCEVSALRLFVAIAIPLALLMIVFFAFGARIG